MTVQYENKEQCDICSGRKLENLFKIRNLEGLHGQFNLLKCKDCGSYYTSPYPAPQTISELYSERKNNQNFDLKSNYFIDLLKDISAKKTLKNFIKKTNLRPRSILDFGTGNGRYAAMSSILFPQAEITACDFMADKPSRLEEPPFRHIKYITTPQLLNSGEKYDLILLRHVIEHIFKPLDFLIGLSGKLTEKGFIYIEVPNIDALYSIPLLRNHYSGYNPPYHLTHYDESAFNLLLSKTNMDFKIWQQSMPLFSNAAASICKRKLNPFFQFIGILLHPIQKAGAAIKGEKEVLCAAVKNK